MKFSRNSKTGILEAYSDDGVYQGNIITMGDTLQEYKERKARSFNMDMIEKMQLRSENVGYGPCPKPEDEVEQHLTITSKGRVWLSRYCFGNGFGEFQLTEKRSFSIPEQSAKMILEALGEYFSKGEPNFHVTDTGSWELTLTDAFDKRFRVDGSLCEDLQTMQGGVSDLIRICLGINDLFVFDGLSEDDIDSDIE